MTTLYNVPSEINNNFVTDQYKFSVYPLDDTIIEYVIEKLLPGLTVVLFSGGFRLQLDAKYIEPKMFANADVVWKPDTMFIDSGNQKMLKYVLSKLQPANILILNSGIFLQYRSWENIQQDINEFKKFSKQIVISLPVNRFDFNRLKYSYTDIAKKLNGNVINKTIIVCQ